MSASVYVVLHVFQLPQYCVMRWECREIRREQGAGDETGSDPPVANRKSPTSSLRPFFHAMHTQKGRDEDPNAQGQSMLTAWSHRGW